MSRQPGDAAYAGVTLRPGRCVAAVIRDATVVPLPRVSRDATRPAGADEVLGAIAAAAPGDIQAVTIDLSRLLLDAVLHPAGSSPVAVIRIVPRAARDPRLARSPAELVERLVARRFTVAGGHDLLGNELCPLDTAGLARVCAHLQRAGVRGVAIVAPGSQAQPEHERTVADAVQAALPDTHISAATDFGGQGLVAREATVILDCALGAITGRLLNVWEDAIRRTGTGAALRVARGDGGYCTPSRARTLPALTLGATDALELGGAAYLHGAQECRVVLPRPGGHVSGDVRHGLAVVRSAELAGIGTALVVPTAVLAPDPGVSRNGERRWVRDVPVVHAAGDPDLLACVGAAVSQPTAWIDEVAFIESAEHLERIRREAEERVSAIVMANGAAPGTAYLAESSIVAVPYSPAGTVRIRLRVAGAAEGELRRAHGPRPAEPVAP
jgi:Hydantoinase/oxoprolinase N-terminal region